MKKNVAGQRVAAQVITAADGTNFTGTVAVTVTIDGGTQTAGGGTVTHEGNGEHSYAPTQAETNGDHIFFRFSGTGAITVGLNVYTGFPQTGDTFARVGAPVGASISADIAAVQSDTDNLQTRIPAALVSGRIDASVGAMAAGVVTAAAIAADAITDAKVASDVTIASVTGAVGSVTGNVGGNVVGSVGSVVADVNTTSNVLQNAALAGFAFLMTDSTTHAPATGKSVTVTRSIDGGAFGAGGLSAVSEVAFGMYKVDFAASDLNGKTIVLRATATGCDDTFERILTQP